MSSHYAIGHPRSTPPFHKASQLLASHIIRLCRPLLHVPVALQLSNVIWAPKEERQPLVQLLRGDAQHATLAVAATTPRLVLIVWEAMMCAVGCSNKSIGWGPGPKTQGTKAVINCPSQSLLSSKAGGSHASVHLFRQHRQGVALIHQTQVGARVGRPATIQQRAVEVSHCGDRCGLNVGGEGPEQSRVCTKSEQQATQHDNRTHPSCRCSVLSTAWGAGLCPAAGC